MATHRTTILPGLPRLSDTSETRRETTEKCRSALETLEREMRSRSSDKDAGWAEFEFKRMELQDPAKQADRILLRKKLEHLLPSAIAAVTALHDRFERILHVRQLLQGGTDLHKLDEEESKLGLERNLGTEFAAAKADLETKRTELAALLGQLREHGCTVELYDEFLHAIRKYHRAIAQVEQAAQTWKQVRDLQNKLDAKIARLRTECPSLYRFSENPIGMYQYRLRGRNITYAGAKEIANKMNEYIGAESYSFGKSFEAGCKLQHKIETKIVQLRARAHRIPSFVQTEMDKAKTEMDEAFHTLTEDLTKFYGNISAAIGEQVSVKTLKESWEVSLVKNASILGIGISDFITAQAAYLNSPIPDMTNLHSLSKSDSHMTRRQFQRYFAQSRI